MNHRILHASVVGLHDCRRWNSVLESLSWIVGNFVVVQEGTTPKIFLSVWLSLLDYVFSISDHVIANASRWLHVQFPAKKKGCQVFTFLLSFHSLFVNNRASQPNQNRCFVSVNDFPKLRFCTWIFRFLHRELFRIVSSLSLSLSHLDFRISDIVIMGSWDCYCAICSGPLCRVRTREDYGEDQGEDGYDPDVICEEDFEWIRTLYILGYYSNPSGGGKWVP